MFPPYLLVVVTRFGDLRTLAVEGLQDIEITDQNFTYPDGLNPEGLLDSAFNLTYDDPIEVKIRFSDDQSRYIKERRWAMEQSIMEQADGSIILDENFG